MRSGGRAYGHCRTGKARRAHDRAQRTRANGGRCRFYHRAGRTHKASGRCDHRPRGRANCRRLTGDRTVRQAGDRGRSERQHQTVCLG